MSHSEELDVDTPVLAVDTNVMERNITRMAQLATRHGVALRPHAKTHKSPQIAKLQLAAGAVGITVAKLGEAEVMVKHGVDDVLIAFPLVGEKKLARLEALLTKAKITVSLDSLEVAAGISSVGERLGARVPVYLEVDTGLKRVGLASGAPSVELGLKVARLPGIEVVGVMTHGGHVVNEVTEAALAAAARRQAEELVETAEQLRAAGVPVKVVSPGGTLSAAYEAATPGVTEIRPGTYVFNDANTVHRFTARIEECAAYVVCTVVSTPGEGRAVIDAGSKTFAADRRADGEGGFGIVLGRPDVTLARLSEEHGMLEFPTSERLAIGEQLRIVPNHICPAVNLSDSLLVLHDGEVAELIPVLARGKRS